MSAPMRPYVTLFINGERRDIYGSHAFLMLADYLRYELGLCGTKIVCAEGDCGACTVLFSRDHENFMPINACIAFVWLFDNCHVITVEALKKNGELSLVQKAVVDHHGSQCGYCTPGFIMAMTGMLDAQSNNLTPQKVKNCLTGNLCRCTGYQPLLDAALALDPARWSPLRERFISIDAIVELKASAKLPVHIVDDEREFFAPTVLDEAIAVLKRYPKARIVSGATDIGVLVNKGKMSPAHLLSLHLLPDLKMVSDDGNRITVGALVTLSDLRQYLKQRVPTFARFLNLFASPQIKNMATIVGNVANGSPIADTIPFLMVAEGAVHVCGDMGARKIPIEKLYCGYKTLALDTSEIITHISFKKLDKTQHVHLEKVSNRKDLDISTVNMAFICELDNHHFVREARIAVGGVSSSVVRLSNVEAKLCGKPLNEMSLNEAAQKIARDISPISDIRGTETYRRMVVDGLFRRYFQRVMGHA